MSIKTGDISLLLFLWRVSDEKHPSIRAVIIAVLPAVGLLGLGRQKSRFLLFLGLGLVVVLLLQESILVSMALAIVWCVRYEESSSTQ